jgi:iron(III) transport system ATP-binding protein
MSETAIQLTGVTKRYDNRTPAVDSITLTVPQGALLALLGPSGCGKTTTLRLVAGLEAPDQGELWIGSTRVAGPGAWVPPESRRVGLVFQDGALFPHLNVSDNIAFGLNGIAKSEKQRRVADLLDTVGLHGFGNRFPHQLSGGQQQRVALARALAPNPPVILLDEPFANLDAALRRDLRLEVARIVRATNTTTIFVTHDQEEALSVADLIAVMDQGQISQIGTPFEIYERPANRSVATFVGEANFLTATAHGSHAATILGNLPIVPAMQGPCTLMIRPEQLGLSPDPAGSAVIEGRTYYGHDQINDVRLRDGSLLMVRTRPRSDLVRGQQVRIDALVPLVAWAE